ncbi:MAG: winged helix-turn-helix domain-containing protein [Pyrinomonadaceae bacterium]
MAAETGRFYEFGNFRLDLDAKTLFCESNPVSLTPKVFDTLQFFVEHAGRLLEKDELMQRIWRDRFVEESNLTFNIKMLRRALKDDAQQPRFIETVPRRGYRFIAEVKEGSAPITASVAANSLSSEHLPLVAKRSYLLAAAVLVLVTGSLVIASWLIRNRPAAAALSAPILSAPFKSERFTNTGSVHAVITPDARYVAYTSETGGKQSIWLRQLETSENIQIVPPSDDSYLGLAVSHDGNSLYFVRKHQTDQSPSAIYRVMTFGGIPVKLAEDSEGRISVSPDDRQISFARCKYQDSDYCSLFVVGTDGRNERKLLTRQRPISISGNQFSPDGKSIAYAAGQSSSGGRDFHLLRFDLAAAGAESEISRTTFFSIRDLKWLPGGDGLLLTAKETLDGKLRIWQVSTATGEARALTQDANNYIDISLDKAADKMIATHVSENFHLYLASAGDLNNPRMLSAARSFAFTPEGGIVYSDNGDIWTINRNGGEQRQLTSNPFADFSPRVSPDGRFIFFASNRVGANQVWRMNADGSNQIQLTKTEGGYPRFVTPDGKWIYFESGLHHTLWRVSTDGGEEMQAAEVSVYSPAFSSDGKLVAYFFGELEGGDHPTIAVLSLADRKVLKTFNMVDEKSVPLKIAWAIDNQALNYVTTNGSKAFLWRQSLDNEKPHLIADLGNEEIQDFALAPDGSSLAFIRGKWIHDAVLIEGLK